MLDSTIPLQRKIHPIEDVIENTLMVVDVVVVDVVVIDMIDDYVHFGTYYCPDFDLQS